MKVNKEQIINGVVSYIENEVIPQVGDKPTQIIVSVAVKSAKANQKFIDSIFENPIFKALLVPDDQGLYEIDKFFDTVIESLKQYGPLPLEIPPIPIVSPVEKILTFNESDVSEIKRRIERSV